MVPSIASSVPINYPVLNNFMILRWRSSGVAMQLGISESCHLFHVVMTVGFCSWHAVQTCRSIAAQLWRYALTNTNADES